MCSQIPKYPECMNRSDPMLTHILSQEDYALALAPGFFRFYAHIGVLHALQDAGCLRVSHLAGCSAGALVATFLAAGIDPPDMADRVLAIQRTDVWDVGGIGGLLKGELFRAKVREHLPVQSFKETRIPLAVTAFDLLRLRTNCLCDGELALAARASCTFPGLFQPAIVDSSPHIDGGVWDHTGLMAMEAAFQEGRRRVPVERQSLAADGQLIVNVVFDYAWGSVLPKAFANCRLLTVVVENIPGVTPFTMQSAGPLAYATAKQATARALQSAHMVEISPNHWVAYVDGALVKDPSMPAPAPVSAPSAANELEVPELDRSASMSSVTTAVLESITEGSADEDTAQVTITEVSEEEGQRTTTIGSIEIAHPHVVEEMQTHVPFTVPATPTSPGSSISTPKGLPSVYSFISGTYSLCQTITTGVHSATESCSLFTEGSRKRRSDQQDTSGGEDQLGKAAKLSDE